MQLVIEIGPLGLRDVWCRLDINATDLTNSVIFLFSVCNRKLSIEKSALSLPHTSFVGQSKLGLTFSPTQTLYDGMSCVSDLT